jgi:hypothetical protein
MGDRNPTKPKKIPAVNNSPTIATMPLRIAGPPRPFAIARMMRINAPAKMPITAKAIKISNHEAIIGILP